MKLKIYLILLILLVSVNVVFAQDKTIVSGETFAFQWEANTEPDLVGYRCFLSMESGVYDITPSNAYATYGLVTQSPNHSISIPGLYFFVLTAYDTEGYQSDISDEQVLLVNPGSTIPASPTGLRFVGISNPTTSEDIIYKDTEYAEFRDHESIKYIPKELYDE